MAEIHIEKKKKPVWPWVLLVLILLVLGWLIYVFVLQDGNTTAWHPLTEPPQATAAHAIPEQNRT